MLCVLAVDVSGPLDARVGSGYAISVFRLRFGLCLVRPFGVFKLVGSSPGVRPPSAQRVV